MNYSEEQIETLIYSIFLGKITVENLPLGLYEAISKYLLSGVKIGVGNIKDTVLLEELTYNIYLFSGAKTFNYVVSSQILLKDENLIGFKEFKGAAREQYNLYNDTWLNAEYNTAIAKAQSAREWHDIKESDVEMVKYVTVHDQNTAEICRVKDGIIRPFKDSFWDTNAPPSHYNCRCLLQGVYEAKETAIPNNLISPDAVFANNPGKTGEIFSKHHPYFAEIPNKYAKLAKENFNLPIP